MDNDEFLRAFTNIDILAAESAAEIVGRIVAKLHSGMVSGGMQPYEANMVIQSAFDSFFKSMAMLGSRPTDD